MITSAIRRGLLANFPAGTPLAIVAPEGAFDGLAAERDDAVEDPVALLAAVRAAAPQARLFALVANAAHLPALAAYFNGGAIAAVRPLVRADVERALADAGWNQIALNPIAEDDPFVTQIGGLSFTLDDTETRERVRPAAFLAIADSQ